MCWANDTALKGIVQIYLIEDLKIYTFFNNSFFINNIKMLIANSAGLQLQRNIGVG